MSVTRQYSFEDLRYLMSRLRDPNTGCPWDCEQDFGTLVKFTLEEAYEVADAIDNGDVNHLSEELGDLLFQIIFYAQLGEERKKFNLDDIVDGITCKLIARHPHVFPAGTLDSVREAGVTPDNAEIGQVWESKKSQERTAKGHRGLLADIPQALPALSRAQKLQKRAAKAGFDWHGSADVLKKIREEIDELSAEITDGNTSGIEDELGDLLFSVVNLARHLGIDSEAALRRGNSKFERRFSHMEQISEASNLGLEELDDDELEKLWQRAKGAVG